MKANLTRNAKLTRSCFIAVAALLISVPLAAQQSQTSQSTQQSQSDKGGKTGDMDGMDMSTMHAEDPAAREAHDSMSGHMDMDAHMYMTTLRAPNPDDQKRAAEIVETVRASIDKYKDYRVALAEGFKIFGPNVPQEQYHFTNYRYAAEAQFVFNPEHPTSLLYKKVDGGYELVGAMFTARKRATEDELNERVPLSVARWHKHVNLCLPPRGTRLQDADFKVFGLRGSIATEEACNEAGGRWIPQIFGWMVHVYPYETDPAKVWAH
jgi:hypothetical protein